jgi:hypothetical protein
MKDFAAKMLREHIDLCDGALCQLKDKHIHRYKAINCDMLSGNAPCDEAAVDVAAASTRALWQGDNNVDTNVDEDELQVDIPH